MTNSNLPNLSSKISMTTVEIAKLTGKQTAHVKRDTYNMLLKLVGKSGISKFGEGYKDINGVDQICYRLPKREVIILVSGYSIHLRAAIIDRLDELENNKSTLPDFSDPAAMAENWAKQYRENQALQIAFEAAKPAIKFTETVQKSGDALRIGEFAKVVSEQTGTNIGQNRLFDYLRNSGYLMKGRDGREKNKPYQTMIEKGFFELKLEISNGQSYAVTYITGTGQIALIEEVIQNFACQKDHGLF